jgi:UDP-N-acetyl-D-galactosamine dehydrogenase
MDSISGMDAVILAVAHREFQGFGAADVARFFGPGQKVLLDLKGLLDRKACEADGYLYWRL